MIAPHYDADFYSDEFMLDPLPHYQKMRELGPVIWLPQYNNFAITQHKEVRATLRNHEVFCSGRGVAADAFGADFLKGNTLASDGARHTELRSAVAAPLLPGAISEITEKVQLIANKLIDDLLKRDSFDTIADLARHLPYTIVSDLVGLPDFGRERQIKWAGAAFDALGVQNARGKAAVETIIESREFFSKNATRDVLKPNSWTHRIHELVECGELSPDLAQYAIRDYVNPSLDSTISAIGQLIWQLANNPQQWEMLKSRPELIQNAINEAVRLGSPARAFTRQTTQDTEISGVKIPANQRVMLLFGCANRDEKVFENPDSFIVDRNPKLHVGFGSGIHMCVGMHLAQLEMAAIVRAMIPRVKRIEVDTPVIALNNTIASFGTLPTTFIAEDRRIAIPSIGACPHTQLLHGTVSEKTIVATDIISLVIKPQKGIVFPSIKPGAHVDIHIHPGLVRQYSLTGDTSNSNYRIAVQKEPNSKGGSVAMHQSYEVGSDITLSMPKNNFELKKNTEPVVLFAGGIGITPLLSMAWQLHKENREFSLHISVRSLDRLAFEHELTQSPFNDRIFIYCDTDTEKNNLTTVFKTLNKNAHIYLCGPRGYMAFIQNQAEQTGLLAEQIHLEHFNAEIDTDGESFTLIAEQSGLTMAVEVNQTILEVLKANDISIETSCEKGVCGSCLTNVKTGIPDHRDMVQTDIEKATNSKIAVCCSRSKSKVLILDI